MEERCCATCRSNNGVAYKHCDIILKENPKGFQIGVEYAMAIVGCCSWEPSDLSVVKESDIPPAVRVVSEDELLEFGSAR